MIDRQGKKVGMLALSPALIKQKLITDLKEKQIHEAIVPRLNLRNRNGRDLMRKGIWLAPIISCLRSKGLSNDEKRLLRGVFTGGIFTGMKLREWGYKVSGFCKVCGKPDSTWHRI